ncbi:phage antirepressor N-terminal domain-containing protein [uncultured Pseudomonas sp.]|uniref:phage antirepressor N-terminal domain-containing protein n=1 Tax=uncultured Pseudomonas sp. TaxID=114707 RepID=UPI002585C922|nr:phage antirepressor N-terminal domain-containing protein [uncultured Pseudomonas sp.]
MHTAPQLFPVPFHGDTVVLVGQDNEPYVAMKPIVANMGMDWPTQYVKLTERFSSTIGEIPTVGEDGKTRSMICLPLKKLLAWLYSISPNKVAPELRDKIIRYQEECDDALWNYWTQGFADRPGPAANASKQIALSRHRLALLKELHRTRDRALRDAIHEQLAQVSRSLGLTVPDLASIGQSDPYVDEILRPFWSAVSYLEDKGIRCNHASPESGKLALNIPELKRLFRDHNLQVETRKILTESLPYSRQPAFIKAGTFRSKTTGRVMNGWIFKIEK